ncbi:MAG TPA: symmetrical bis(5'-nucleosyl)-tetraphosphatase [Steroidobacteraceae bacterium]|jgi:bis(5'-nucleosyl)-tetraphosphatase (symmetrical)
MAIYAIGDIQGCGDEFEALLARLRFDPARDRLWLTGDLVNRGPRSLDVLRFVKRLGAAAITVLGNHDLHLLAAALTPRERLKPQDTLGEIFAAPDRDELLTWLRSLPLLHHDATLGYTMVHAGLPPQWDLATAQACASELERALRDDQQCIELFTHMYGDRPNRWADELRGVERLRFITNCLTRLRFCRSDGTLELQFKGKVDLAPAGVVPWFRVPQRRSRDLRIVCGHWSALGYHDGDGVLSIDTGCVWGDRLCAVRLDRREAPVFVPCSSSGLSPDSE